MEKVMKRGGVAKSIWFSFLILIGVGGPTWWRYDCPQPLLVLVLPPQQTFWSPIILGNHPNTLCFNFFDPSFCFWIQDLCGVAFKVH